ncbi:MAG: TetR/AcrR family transcriptional regulator [Leucobacter sp.]
MTTSRAPRNTLTRDRVIAGALELADTHGLESLTIRALAHYLGVRPMSIYHYVSTKDELLDALVDAVFSELYMPAAAGDWRTELVSRAESARITLARHPWALAVMETRAQPGPANLAAHEAVLELLHVAGFSVEAAGHAYAILDAFIYGFALQDSMLRSVELNTSAEELRNEMDLSRHPRLAAMAAHFVEAETYPIDASYNIGLALALDGIARLRNGSE